jgi:hypothetical protein
VARRISVTGLVELAARSAGGAIHLELDSALGRYRLDLRGLAVDLVRHVGELVTVVAVVSPFATEGPRLLRVERFTLHEG